MGSIGNNQTNSSSKNLVGQDTSNFRKYSESWSVGTKALIEDFNLDWASEKQVEAARRILAGAYEYDKDYDKKPYKITRMDIQPLNDTNVMVFTMWTEPDTPSAYLRITDGKNRHIFIGKNGGMSIVGKKGGTVRLTEWEAQYWPQKVR